MRLIPSLAVLLGLASATVAAADVSYLDLRIGAGVLSNEYKGTSTTTVTDGNGSVTTIHSSDDGRDADHNWRGQVQLVGGQLGSAGGLVYGVGVAMNRATWENGSQDAHVSTPVIDILLGYGYAFTSNWHLELTPFAGVGRAYYSVSDGNSSSTSKEWNNYVEYGAKLGSYLTLDGGLQLGVEVPWLVGRFDPDYDHQDGTDQYSVSDERRNQGLGLLVSVGVRF